MEASRYNFDGYDDDDDSGSDASDWELEGVDNAYDLKPSVWHVVRAKATTIVSQNSHCCVYLRK